MQKDTLRVIAIATALPGKTAELRGVLEELISPTRAEAGCLRYELWANAADPDELTFVEEWTSEEALAEHLATAHIARARVRFPELLAKPMELRKYRLIA